MDEKDKLIASLQKRLISALMMRDHEIGVKRRGKVRMTEVLAERTRDNRRLRNFIENMREQHAKEKAVSDAAIAMFNDMWPSCPNYAVNTDDHYNCAFCDVTLHRGDNHKPDCLWLKLELAIKELVK